jgi:hypothetical protein
MQSPARSLTPHTTRPRPAPPPRFTEDAAAAQSQAGGVSSLFFGGALYDAVKSSRRGVTSLGWAKPKMSFRANGGKKFK